MFIGDGVELTIQRRVVRYKLDGFGPTWRQFMASCEVIREYRLRRLLKDDSPFNYDAIYERWNNGPHTIRRSAQRRAR